jgi:hypothetical protein
MVLVPHAVTDAAIDVAAGSTNGRWWRGRRLDWDVRRLGGAQRRNEKQRRNTNNAKQNTLHDYPQAMLQNTVRDCSPPPLG